MFSEIELPCDYLRRVELVAFDGGDKEVAALFRAFANEWDSRESSRNSTPALSWRMAKLSPIGRAILNLASTYVSPKGMEI